MTRYGMKETDMQELAPLIKAGLEGKVIKDQVVQLRSRFTEVHYAWLIQKTYIIRLPQRE